jgi:nitroreductase
MYTETDMDDKTSSAEEALAGLLTRRSVSPKRLRRPGPGLLELELILQAALRAPDHGGLHPWRVIEFRADEREALADCFEQEKLRRDSLASPDDVRRAREHATSPPVLLAFVVAPQARAKVPLREQWLGAGAALGNLLNAAHLLGFGAIMLSGERCFDAALANRIGIGAEEFLAGFISLGTVAEAPPTARSVSPERVWSRWMPDAPRSTIGRAAAASAKEDDSAGH